MDSELREIPPPHKPRYVNPRLRAVAYFTSWWFQLFRGTRWCTDDRNCGRTVSRCWRSTATRIRFPSCPAVFLLSWWPCDNGDGPTGPSSQCRTTLGLCVRLSCSRDSLAVSVESIRSSRRFRTYCGGRTDGQSPETTRPWRLPTPSSKFV